jgi:adhesin/invasin
VNSPHFRSAAAVAIALLAVAACDHGPKIGPPEKITKIGDAQTGTVASPLAIRPAILIQDADGRGVPGVAVMFSVSSGGGIVTGGATQTDETGTARVEGWTLGTTAGANTLVANATGVPGSPVSFVASATAGPVATIAKVGTDPATAPAGGNLDSIVVRVSDQFGNPVAGQTINFTVTRGAGIVSPSSRQTLADGRAAARWTLGPDVDSTNIVVAARPDGSFPVTFSTVATRAIASVRFAERFLIVDSLASITPAVTAFDQGGSAVNGASISLMARAASIATTTATTVTGARAGQTILVARATDNPAATDSALVIVGNAGAPVVRLTMPGFELKADTTFTVSLIVDMRSSPTTIGATTMHVVWDPSVLTFVSQVDGSTAGSTTNTSSVGTGSLTFAYASAGGVGGAIELKKITFRASATVGRSGTLTANVVDMSAGPSSGFANLAPMTVSGLFPVRIR